MLFQSLNAPQNHLSSLWKRQFLGPHPRVIEGQCLTVSNLEFVFFKCPHGKPNVVSPGPDLCLRLSA